jgi:hypothetical protein
MNTTTKEKERTGKITMAIVGQPGQRPVGKTALLVDLIRTALRARSTETALEFLTDRTQ